MLDSQPDEALAPPHSLTFEEAFTRLGAMVETLESGGLPLDQAARMFEEGMALVRRCGQLLDETELRIAEIRESANAPASSTTTPGAPEGFPGATWRRRPWMTTGNRRKTSPMTISPC